MSSIEMLAQLFIKGLAQFQGAVSSLLICFVSSEEVTNSMVAEHAPHVSMAPLLFIIVSLLIGTASRYWLRRFALPYTISLFIIGLFLGLAYRIGFFSTMWGISDESGLIIFGNAIYWAGHIDPHLIFYIFLPTLIFEAAFGMNVHTFKKTFTNAFILAVPGIVVALLLTAAFVMLIKTVNIGLGMWTWPVALMFGTMISATDPVAVVSILKEVGASRNLATLIEGESIFNDGTAIVIFMVFFASLSGAANDSNAVFEFVRVVLGGVAVGVIIGWIVVSWLKRVFNDALLEITVVVSAAYITFFIAEHFFHISGVLAVVSFGIMMAGIGRTRISPQVDHFLHEFWELAAFIANTLIFIIVGVVIALRVSFTANDFLILILVYIAIHLVRAVVLTMFYPLMKRFGYGLSPKEGVIAWWGGLRGAIGLALALIVSSEVSIDAEIRTQILSLMAGTVFLTSLINATTMKLVIEWFGLTRVGAARLQLLNQTVSMLRKGGEKEVSKLKEDRFMTGADWDIVDTYLPESKGNEVASKSIDTLLETRKRMLIKEKESYWRQFSEGLLTPAAVQNLSGEIDYLLDFNGTISLAKRKDLENMWQTPKILTKMQTIPLFGRFWRRQFYRRLALSYDCARGFVVANEENLKSLSSLIIGLSAGNQEISKEVEKLSKLEDEINENRIMGLTFLRNLRDTYPEVYHAIETQIASRSLLNYQMASIQKLEKQGRLETADAKTLEGGIQGMMKKIIDTPPEIKTTEALRYMISIPALSSLSEGDMGYFANLFVEKVFPTDAKIVTEDSPTEVFYIIIRGSARVKKNSELLKVVQPGSVVGAYECLAGGELWASYIADSPVTALKCNYSNMQKRIARKPDLLQKVWLFAGFDLAERMLVRLEPWRTWRTKKLRGYISQGNLISLELKEAVEFDERFVILVNGLVSENSREVLSAPSLIRGGSIKAEMTSTLFVLPKIEKAE